MYARISFWKYSKYLVYRYWFWTKAVRPLTGDEDGRNRIRGQPYNYNINNSLVAVKLHDRYYRFSSSSKVTLTFKFYIQLKTLWGWCFFCLFLTFFDVLSIVTIVLIFHSFRLTRCFCSEYSRYISQDSNMTWGVIFLHFDIVFRLS